ncbi:MAG: trypsin-like peptidase domain-containing protein [Chloroflexi bacterium]|nr:trypsin-like peptidase domain-containing protein [Chloroflexota bacterium]
MVSVRSLTRRCNILVLTCLLFSLLSFGCAAGGSPSPTASFLAGPDTLPSLSRVVNRVLPSVVYINVLSEETDFFGEPFEAAGSGVILRSDGYILTNKHVVEGARTIEVTLHDRRVYQVSAGNKWLDDIVDLAVLKIDEKDLPTVTFADPDGIEVGDWVVAIGHALGLSPVEGGATVTQGIVSNLGRSISIDGEDYYDLIQTDAAIIPGTSGGPLVNQAGAEVGINAAGATAAQAIGFAINVGTARHVFEDLVKYGRPHHPYIGMALGDVTPASVKDARAPRAGALITDIEPSSPAHLGGLLAGDIVTQFGKAQIRTAADLIKELWRLDVGDKVDIVYWRENTEVKITVTLGQRPQTRAV